jgi:predicted NAD/FAD-dependent oxidoreductase
MIAVIIVGAGIAGLACARRLVQAGVPALVFDKGRGIGGRVATRRADGLQFDHGAQYVTAKGEEFAAVLRDLVTAGDATLWPDCKGRPRIVGTPGMVTLGKALAAGLDVRQGVQVTSIRPVVGGWQVEAGDVCHEATRVVVTLPAPQVAGVLGADHPLVAMIGGVRMEPCLTLMASINAPPPFVTREAPDDPITWIAQDSAKPGRPKVGAVAWVAQAGPAFSAAHLNDDPAAIAARMLPMLCERLGVTAARVTHAAAHRWRYARVTASLGQTFLRDASGALYLGGDWCIGPRVEAAWTSGTAIADDLLAQMP